MSGSFDLENIPVPTLEEGWEQDSTSLREAKFWDEYDDISKVKRNNTLLVHKTIGWLIPIALVFAFLGFLAMSGIYIWHLISRHDLRWLEAGELQNIHSMIFSSVVGGAIAILAKTYFAAPKED